MLRTECALGGERMSVRDEAQPPTQPDEVSTEPDTAPDGALGQPERPKEPPSPDGRSVRFDSRTILEQTLRSDRTLSTLLLFSILIIKVIFVAKGDLTTALAVLATSGLVTVILGALVALLPIIAAAIVVVGFYRLGSGAWKLRTLGKQSLIVVLVLLASVMLTPWLVLAASPLALIGGRLARFRKKLRTEAKATKSPAKVWVAHALLVAAIAALVIAPFAIVGPDLVFSMWLPREEIRVASSQNAPQQPLLVGYVLKNEGGWMSVLTSVRRRVEEVKSDTIVSRRLCRKNYHEPIWQLSQRKIFDSDTRLPRCIA
jgi:hypothetical protein